MTKAHTPVEAREFGGWISQLLSAGLTGDDMRRLEEHPAEVQVVLAGLEKLADKLRHPAPLGPCTTSYHPSAARFQRRFDNNGENKLADVLFEPLTSRSG